MGTIFSKLSLFVFVFLLLAGTLLYFVRPALAYTTWKECDAAKCKNCIEQDAFLWICGDIKPGPAGPGTVINPIAPDLSPSSGDAAVGLFSRLIQSLVSTLIIIAAVVFFFMFLIGAIKWITSSGDKAQIESARGTILNALVGLVIVFSIFALLTLLEKLFGINILQIDAGALKIQ